MDAFSLTYSFVRILQALILIFASPTAFSRSAIAPLEDTADRKESITDFAVYLLGFRESWSQESIS
jgi:hypothetical protein